MVVPLALASLVVLALAWSSWDAGRDHRLSAERTVRDYADFASALIAANADALLGQTLLYAFYAVDLAEREGSTEPVPPSAVATNPPEAGRCAAAYPEGRWFARLGEALETVGPISPALAAWLAGALRDLLRAPPGDSRQGNLFPPIEGESRLIAYRLRRASDGGLVEAHAFAHCLEGRNVAGRGFGPALFLSVGGSTAYSTDLSALPIRSALKS